MTIKISPKWMSLKKAILGRVIYVNKSRSMGQSLPQMLKKSTRSSVNCQLKSKLSLTKKPNQCTLRSLRVVEKRIFHKEKRVSEKKSPHLPCLMKILWVISNSRPKLPLPWRVNKDNTERRGTLSSCKPCFKLQLTTSGWRPYSKISCSSVNSIRSNR